jgi:hypothetical protein
MREGKCVRNLSLLVTPAHARERELLTMCDNVHHKVIHSFMLIPLAMISLIQHSVIKNVLKT